MASDWPRTFLQPGCFCLVNITPKLYLTQDLEHTVYVKTAEGENFRGFRGFCSIAKVFLSNILLD